MGRGRGVRRRGEADAKVMGRVVMREEVDRERWWQQLGYGGRPECRRRKETESEVEWWRRRGRWSGQGESRVEEVAQSKAAVVREVL